MSDKFDMKVVIDAVTTPLLHARLGGARSYRERAALLRSLAEAALRGTPQAQWVSEIPSSGAASDALTASDASGAHAPGNERNEGNENERALTQDMTQAPMELQGTNGNGHDIGELADQFADYLGVAT